jgi:hypothetical protein
VEPPVALFDAASALVPGNRRADMVRPSALACSGDFLLRLAGCQGKDLVVEARRASLTAARVALMINPNEIQLPTAFPEVEKTRWSELFKYPRLVASGMLTGLTQTGGASLGLWGATLLVLVMRVSPADAAYLMIWVSVSAVLGRFFITALIEPLGRRGSATLCMVCGGVGIIAQGYLYDTKRVNCCQFSRNPSAIRADERASSKTRNRLQEHLLRADMTTDMRSAPDADNGFTE